MILYLWIAAGSACGGVARFALSAWIGARYGEVFPWGTLLVNVTGCFAMGILAVLVGPEGRLAMSSEARNFLLVGLLGGYTTFSAFSIQTLSLLQEGSWLRAGSYILGSVVCCLLAVWLGHLLASAVAGSR